MKRYKQSLAEVNPKLANEWHPTKNANLTPHELTPGSNKKVWWKCEKGNDHEYIACINHRSNGSGCPICDGKKVVLSTCLATTHPKLAKEWHPTKNGDLTPFDVMAGSAKKVWWMCEKGDDHEWCTSPSSRSNQNTSCLVCSGQKVVPSNSLAVRNPELSKQWHPTKNGKLTPFDVTVLSSKRVWWKCAKGEDHEWQSSVSNRSNGSGCGICSGKVIVSSTSLATLRPDIAKQWHPTKNGKLTANDVSVLSNKRVWWACEKGEDHEWKVSIAHRTSGKNCPICSGHKVVLSNSLATLNPSQAKEWHPTLNGKTTPENVGAGAKSKAWWKCKEGEDHVWHATIANRNKGIGCPICNGKKIVLSTCLVTTHSSLAKEWHPKKNGELTAIDVGAGSHKRVWWKCDKGNDHEWKTAIKNRSSGSSCPYCTLTPQSKQELIISFELSLFFPHIDPKGFKTIVNDKIWSIDIYIPKLNVGVEFDGSYWHKDKAALDKQKTIQLNQAGFNVIRIREEPLTKIFDTDIISKNPYNSKEITDNILKQISSSYSVKKKTIIRINKYLNKSELQNQNALEKYIEHILIEKAKKNELQHAL